MVKAAVCKTVLGLFLSWVRFPPGPPNSDVAQLDRAPDYGSGDCWFESSHPSHS